MNARLRSWHFIEREMGSHGAFCQPVAGSRGSGWEPAWVAELTPYSQPRTEAVAPWKDRRKARAYVIC